jgi:hypothetical protein
MDMKVRDFLMGIDSDVGEQAISGLNQPHFARNIAHGTHKSGYFGVGGCGAEIIPADIGALGNGKDMLRRLRVYVVKGECPFILEHLAAWYFFAQDFGEDILVIIFQSRVNRHVSLPNIAARRLFDEAGYALSAI